MPRFLDIAVDDRCLRQAAAGDSSAQRQLYDLLAGPMFALVRRVVRDRAAAEDVFQDSMLAVLRHLPTFRGDAPFGAWARSVALNQCLEHLRSPWQRARSALREWAGDTSDVTRNEISQPAFEPPLADRVDLERALAKLGATARTVLWLHDVEGLTHDEIATLFARSPSFSKSQLARAHALLRVQLADHTATAKLSVGPSAATQGQVS